MDTQLEWNLSKVISALDTKPAPWGLIGRLVLVDKLTPEEVERLTWRDVVDAGTGEVFPEAMIDRSSTDGSDCRRKVALSEPVRESLKLRWCEMNCGGVRWINFVTGKCKDGAPVWAEEIVATINRTARSEIHKNLLDAGLVTRKKRTYRRNDVKGLRLFEGENETATKEL